MGTSGRPRRSLRPSLRTQSESSQGHPQRLSRACCFASIPPSSALSQECRNVYIVCFPLRVWEPLGGRSDKFLCFRRKNVCVICLCDSKHACFEHRKFPLRVLGVFWSGEGLSFIQRVFIPRGPEYSSLGSLLSQDHWDLTPSRISITPSDTKPPLQRRFGWVWLFCDSEGGCIPKHTYLKANSAVIGTTRPPSQESFSISVGPVCLITFDGNHPAVETENRFWAKLYGS